MRLTELRTQVINSRQSPTAGGVQEEEVLQVGMIFRPGRIVNLPIWVEMKSRGGPCGRPWRRDPTRQFTWRMTASTLP